LALKISGYYIHFVPPDIYKDAEKRDRYFGARAVGEIVGVDIDARAAIETFAGPPGRNYIFCFRLQEKLPGLRTLEFI